MPSLEFGWYYQQHYIGEKWFSSYPHTGINFRYLFGKGEILCPPLLSTLRFCLIWTSAGPVHAFIVSVTSCVSALCPWSHPSLLGLTFFWTPLLHRSLSLDGRSLIKSSLLWLSALKSFTFWTMFSFGQEEPFLMSDWCTNLSIEIKH